MTEEYYCATCNQKLTKDEKPCPSCGSIKRNIHLELFEKLVITDKLKALQKSQEKRDDGKPIKEIKMNVENNIEKIIHTDRRNKKTITIQLVMKEGTLLHFHDKTGKIEIRQKEGNIYTDKEGNIYLRATPKDDKFKEIFVDSNGKEYKFLIG